MTPSARHPIGGGPSSPPAETFNSFAVAAGSTAYPEMSPPHNPEVPRDDFKRLLADLESKNPAKQAPLPQEKK